MPQDYHVTRTYKCNVPVFRSAATHPPVTYRTGQRGAVQLHLRGRLDRPVQTLARRAGQTQVTHILYGLDGQHAHDEEDGRAHRDSHQGIWRRARRVWRRTITHFPRGSL